jgi:hypothetical protein
MPAGAEAVKRLAALGLCTARLKALREGPARGVAGALDVCQFAADFGRNSFHERLEVSMDNVESGLTAVRDLVLFPGWSREDLGHLESSLETFDRNLPSEAEVSLNEMARFIKLLLSETTLDQMGWAGWEWYRQWNFGFSRRLRLAVELSEMERLGRELAPALDKSRGERLKAFAAFTPDSTMAAALVQVVFGRMGTVEGNRARLNLLRTAVHYLRTGEVLQLEDPYGNFLHTRKEGERLILWSEGWSSLDSEGIGGWTTSEIASSTKGHNIVLQVGR